MPGRIKSQIVNRQEKSMKFSIIVPVFNEEQGLPEVLESLIKLFPLEEIIVVDDGSTDKTNEIACRFNSVKVIRHDRNYGYGAALKTGINHASTEKLVFFDADGQHDAGNIKNFIGLLKECDLAAGERLNDMSISGIRLPGKFILKILVNFLAKTKIKDINCGFRAVRKSIIKRYLFLLPDGFSFSTTTILLFLKRKYRVKFIPIQAKRRTGKSSVNQFRDGYNTLLLIIRLIALFDPLRIFMPAGFFFIVWGLVYGIYKIITVGFGLPAGALALLITGFIGFLLGIICDQISSLRLERLESYPKD